jgi:hypothetical protein
MTWAEGKDLAKIVALIGVGLFLAYIGVLGILNTSLSLTGWRKLAEILALLAAAVFFMYKAVTGYLITNMSIELQCFRQPIPHKAEDYLHVIMTLTKGDKGTVRIHDAQARMHIEGEEHRTVSFSGASRLSFITKTVEGFKRHVINWDTRSEKNPFLNLSPGEKAQFSCFAEVPRHSLCTVEVAVLGNHVASWKMGQWRASFVSLPERAEPLMGKSPSGGFGG